MKNNVSESDSAWKQQKGSVSVIEAPCEPILKRSTIVLIARSFRILLSVTAHFPPRSTDTL